MTSLKPGTPAMEAYQKVREAIAQQKLKPGRPLTENFLCDNLGLGRSPVRAALQQLALEGFVEMPPNRSARVSQFSQTQVRQIYSLRGMVLSHALELTIGTYSERDIQYLTECLDRQEKAFQSRDFEDYLSSVYDFFFFMIHKANNPYLDEISDAILKRINVFLFLYDNFYSVEKLKTLPMYRKIIKGIQQGKRSMVMQVHKELCGRILDAYDHMILNNTE